MSAAGEAQARRVRRRTIAHAADVLDAHCRDGDGGRMSAADEAQARRVRRRTMSRQVVGPASPGRVVGLKPDPQAIAPAAHARDRATPAQGERSGGDTQWT
jgi:hypothetical protein